MSIQIIALGNPLRGDDGAGPALLQRLRAVPVDPAAGIELIEHSGPASDLPLRWTGAAAVYLLDAAVSGAAPGTLHRIDGLREPLPVLRSSPSSHGGDVAAAIELARSLALLPPRLWIYAIEGRDFQFGARLSAAVAEAVEKAARQLLAELHRQIAVP